MLVESNSFTGVGFKNVLKGGALVHFELSRYFAFAFNYDRSQGESLLLFSSLLFRLYLYDHSMTEISYPQFDLIVCGS